MSFAEDRIGKASNRFAMEQYGLDSRRIQKELLSEGDKQHRLAEDPQQRRIAQMCRGRAVKRNAKAKGSDQKQRPRIEQIGPLRFRMAVPCTAKERIERIK